jgi:hypothetical protein
MTKLNIIMYRKLFAQAEEAREQGLIKLADSIVDAIGLEPEEELKEYSYGQFQDDVHKDLWKLATRIMTYYDIESADVSKIDGAILAWASKVTDDLESILDIDSSLNGALDPIVPGEDK